MNAELWQFAAVAVVGSAVILLWLFLVYLPRRTGEGGTVPEDAREDDAENDDLP